MVTTISQSFYESLQPKPTLHSIEELSVTGASGIEKPYIGYMEVSITIPDITEQIFHVPGLVVSDYDFYLAVPMIVGTNVLRFLKALECEDMSPAWQSAISALSLGSPLGNVVSTNNRPIEIQPYQT
ncbi:hypothetical protein DPMN_091811 [Dreissena polymorpha]|uniref:Uncharacterized protein n=1 Tax=Dreissena polymorpha TaxID=45954 RepID=A0A9D4L066_DREPO|nr:hypothetical protein DPMN_091811 [Dreissena polymorpha]